MSDVNRTDEKFYADRDVIKQGQVYVNHVLHMTSEALHSKSDIAAELAHRDIELYRLQEKLRLLEHDADMSFKALEMYGVPRERARSVMNGIQVLMSRMDKESQSLKAECERLRQDADILRTQIDTQSTLDVLRLDFIAESHADINFTGGDFEISSKYGRHADLDLRNAIDKAMLSAIDAQINQSNKG